MLIRLLGTLGLLAGLATAAGTDDGDAGQWIVAARPDAWTRAAEPPPPRVPLALRWDFDSLGDDWTSPGASRLRDGTLQLLGRGLVELTGPAEAPLDTTIHHWLAMRVRTENVARITLMWRAADGRFNANQAFHFEPAADGTLEDYSLRLDQLRGRARTASADQVARAFRLVFSATRPDGDEPVRVDVDSLALLSDFEDGEGRGLRETTLNRGSVVADGVAVRLPAELGTDLEVRAGDRLRLRLALAGRGAATTVTIGDAGGRLPAHEVALRAGEPWHPVELDLSPLGDGPARLRLAAGHEGAVLLVGAVLQMRRADDARPPVLLYMEDTLRADRLGTYGYEHATDPALQRIAGQGAVFTRTYASSNWTRPAVSSLLTSMHPVDHRNIDNDRRIAADAVPLARALADAGYLTVSLITNHHAGSGSALDRGFDLVHEPQAIGLLDDKSTLTSTRLRPPLFELLERHRDERVFVYVHSLDPHFPYIPPREQLAAIDATAERRARPAHVPGELAARHDEESRLYDAEILHNDVELGRLDERLEALGLLDEVLLVFVSDHGESLGEHGAWQHRATMFEDEVRVPWVLRRPGLVAAGRRVDVPVSHVDVAPTILGLVGIGQAPGAWAGRDLSALVTEDESSEPVAPATIFIDAFDDGTRSVAVVAGGRKLVMRRGPRGELTPVAFYDLEEDPAELDDRLRDPDRREEIVELMTLVADYLARDVPAEEQDGHRLDPEQVEWMREMGYLK